MKRLEMERNLRALGQKLHARAVTGDILIVGGAYMLLVLASREATRDIDAYFDKDRDAIRAAAAEVAVERGLPADWLNDAVKGFMRRRPDRTDLWRSYPGLNIYAPDPEYVFAMKAEAARVATSDIDDLKVLIRELKLRTVAQALVVVERYVPAQLRSMRTQLTLEAIFEEMGPVTTRRAPSPWLAVRLPSNDRTGTTAKTHLAAPKSRLTKCGRSIRALASGTPRTSDPRRVIGAALCATCERSWKVGDR